MELYVLLIGEKPPGQLAQQQVEPSCFLQLLNRIAGGFQAYAGDAGTVIGA